MTRPASTLLFLAFAFGACIVGPDERLENPDDPLSTAYTPGLPRAFYASLYNDSLVVLEWYEDASAEQGFRIYRRSAPDTTFRLIGATGRDTTVFQDREPKSPGVEYTYRLFVFAGPNQNSRYLEASTRFLLPAPTPGTVSGTSTDRVRLQWSATSTFRTETLIERDGGDGFRTVAIAAPGVTSFSDISVDSRRVFTYRLSSRTSHNTSPGVTVRAVCEITGQSQDGYFVRPATGDGCFAGLLAEDQSFFISVSTKDAAIMQFPGGALIRLVSLADRQFGIAFGAALSRDNQMFAVGGTDTAHAVVWVYGVNSGALLRKLSAPGLGSTLVLANDGSVVVVSTNDGVVRCMKVEDGTTLWERVFAPGRIGLWIPPGVTEVFVGYAGGCEYLDLATGVTKATTGGSAFLPNPVIASDGDVLICGNGMVFNTTRNRMEASSVPEAHAWSVSKDRSVLLTATRAGVSQIRNLVTGRIIAFSPEMAGEHVFASLLSGDKQVVLHTSSGGVQISRFAYSWKQL